MYGGLSFTALPHHLKRSRKRRDVEWMGVPSIETATDNGRVMGYVPTAVYFVPGVLGLLQSEPVLNMEWICA